jgi:tRNA pseudouridine13 synthase
LPGKSDPCWDNFNSENIIILQAIRHNKKLQRGVLVGNEFTLIIRDWQGDRGQTEAILAAIKTQGLANYFGEQRFGINGQNINQALAMFQGTKVKRQQRSLYLSSVRSFLFNEMLAERVKQKNWNCYIEGDVLMFDKSRSYFKTDILDKELSQRVDTGEVHPSGLLYGIGNAEVSGPAASIEQAVCERHPELLAGLIKAKVESARRPLRVRVKNLSWRFSEPNALTLDFALPAGSYATSLLREIINQD